MESPQRSTRTALERPRRVPRNLRGKSLVGGPPEEVGLMAMYGTPSHLREHVLWGELHKRVQEAGVPYVDREFQGYEYLDFNVESGENQRISVGYQARIQGHPMLPKFLKEKKLLRKSFRSKEKVLTEGEWGKITDHVKLLYFGCRDAIEQLRGEIQGVAEVLGYDPGESRLEGLFPGMVKKVGEFRYHVEMETILTEEQLRALGQLIPPMTWWERKK